MKIPAKERKFLPQEENSCLKKEITAPIRKLMPQEGNTCHKKEIPASRRKLFIQGGKSYLLLFCWRNSTFCYSREIMSWRRSSWGRLFEWIFCYTRKFLFQEKVLCNMKDIFREFLVHSILSNQWWKPCFSVIHAWLRTSYYHWL